LLELHRSRQVNKAIVACLPRLRSSIEDIGNSSIASSQKHLPCINETPCLRWLPQIPRFWLSQQQDQEPLCITEYLWQKASIRYSATQSSYVPRSSNRSSVAPTNNGQPSVEGFWAKDVFICNYDGRPPFYCACLDLKHDQAHNGIEVDRYV
jgi:hypothetical protein